MMDFANKLEDDTSALALPTGRRVGGQGHDVAREFLLARLAEIDVQPFSGDSLELPFEHDGVAFTNVVGVLRGSDPDARPVLLGAHYDSALDAPSADDNATGVAVALAIAEHLAGDEGRRRDLVIALFDSGSPPFQDTGAMGSTRFYDDHCHGVNFACAIVMDLIGHDVEIQHPAAAMMPALKRMLFVLGAESDSALPEVVEWAAGEAKGLKVFPTLNGYLPDTSDHRAFRLGGQPFLFLSCGPGEHYRKPTDDLSWINFEKLRHVAAFVADLISRLDRSEPAGETCDPVDFEIRMIKKVVGMAFPMLLKMAGLQPLKSRDDVDALAKRLLESATAEKPEEG